jgi:hypothetical protein
MGFLSSVAGNLTGGILGTSDTEEAAKDAKRLSNQAAKKSETEFGDAWGDIEKYISPYIEAGTEALGQYKEALGVTPETPVFEDFDFDESKMAESPAYKFIMDQEMQATDRIQAKNRALTSGNRLTATQDRAAGVASQEYGNEWERQFKGNEYNNQLMAAKYGIDYQNQRDFMGDTGNLISGGQNAATNLSSQRMQQANSMSNIWNRQAADVTAANLLPGQEKQNFIGGLMSMGGQALGSGMFSNKPQPTLS